jgi:glycosyltransferase involved in cell wall biosynthesis
VLEQSYPVTWIVTDADSGTAHREYLSSLNSENHIIDWDSKKDRGLYDGMNRGFTRSKGDIVLFLNAGDTLSSSTIIQQIANDFVNDEWNWCVGLAVRFNQQGEPRAIWEYLQPEIGGLALGTRTFCHQATFYRQSFLEKYMPYKVDNLAADHLLNVKMFKDSTPKMLPLVTTFFQDGGISANRPFRAAMKDLRGVRFETNLLLGGNRFYDKIISEVIIMLIQIGGLCWNLMRKLGHRIIQEPKRITPEN